MSEKGMVEVERSGDYAENSSGKPETPVTQNELNGTRNPQAVDASPGVSRGVKLILLVVLCLQNAVYTMLRRYRYDNWKYM